MKRKSKKLKKSTPIPKTTESTNTNKEIKKEHQIESNEKASVLSPEDLVEADLLKKEPDLIETLKSEIKLENSNSKFLLIELKLISIDIKCSDYEKLEQRFLCVDSKASIDHVKKFIVKKMNILEDFFEELIVLYYGIIERNIKAPKNITSSKLKEAY